MPWLAVTLEVEPGNAESLSDALLESGARAVSLDELDAARHRLHALLDLGADAQAILVEAGRIAGLTAMPAYALSRVEDEDWVRRSQAQFQPLQVGARLWVGPTWHMPPPGMHAVVRLDPGLAFGTGSHP